MKNFLYKVIVFIITILVFCILLSFLPTTPRAAKSLLAASMQKDSLMKNLLSPRIIFLGGSNLSFGLDSQMIKDSLKLNPINTGITVSITPP